MRQRDAMRARRIATSFLIAAGILFLLLDLPFVYADLTAMGPEDEVPFSPWVMPVFLVLGTASLAAGMRWAPRGPYKAPPGWLVNALICRVARVGRGKSSTRAVRRP